MESQNIVNLLNDTENESSKLTTKICYSLMIKITQNMVKEMKIIQAFNLRQKSSNEVVVIIQMHIFL